MEEQGPWTSFKGAVANRLENPFVGTFILSWCLFNWRLLVLLLLGDKPAGDRLVEIDAQGLAEIRSRWFGLFIGPLLVAAVYPFASVIPLALSGWATKLRNAVRQRIGAVKLESLKDARARERKFRDQEERHARDFKSQKERHEDELEVAEQEWECKLKEMQRALDEAAATAARAEAEFERRLSGASEQPDKLRGELETTKRFLRDVEQALADKDAQVTDLNRLLVQEVERSASEEPDVAKTAGVRLRSLGAKGPIYLILADRLLSSDEATPVLEALSVNERRTLTEFDADVVASLSDSGLIEEVERSGGLGGMTTLWKITRYGQSLRAEITDLNRPQDTV